MTADAFLKFLCGVGFLLLLPSNVECACTVHHFMGQYGMGQISTEDESRCRMPNGMWSEGCYVTFPCARGHYFEDYPYGVKAKCVNGTTWATQELTFAELPPCLPGCTAMEEKQLHNATVVGEMPITYHNGDEKLWASLTEVHATCKPGFIFTCGLLRNEPEAVYRCVNGMWVNVILNVPSAVILAGICAELCDPLTMSQLPEHVILSRDPAKIANKYVVKEGIIKILPDKYYEYTCEPGYTYFPPHDLKGRQRLWCVGGDQPWMDKETGKRGVQALAQCELGCVRLSCRNVPSFVTMRVRKGCEKTEDVMKDGCRVSIRPNIGDGVKIGYYSISHPFPMELLCVNNTWVDEHGNEIHPSKNKTILTGVRPGCPVPTPEQMTRLEISAAPQERPFTNGGALLFPKGAIISVECVTGYIRPNTSEQPWEFETFVCTDSGWRNMNRETTYGPAECIPACIVPIARSVRIDPIGNISMKGDKRYVLSGTKIKVNEGQVQKEYTCNGELRGWVEDRTKIENVVLPGDRNSCLGIERNFANIDVVSSRNCASANGMVAVGCEYKIRCKAGFLPKMHVFEQTVTCTNRGTYVDATNNPVISLLGCEPACSFAEYMPTASYVKQPSPGDVVVLNGVAYVRQDTTVSIICKKGFRYNNQFDHNRGDYIPVVYVCKGGKRMYLKKSTNEMGRKPGDVCSSFIPEQFPGHGTDIRPIIQCVPHRIVVDGVVMVTGVGYKWHCGRGFEFPSGSPLPPAYSCSVTTEEFDVFSRKTEVCVEATEPTCYLREQFESNMMEIHILTRECDVNRGHYGVGCMMNLSCRRGSYPKGNPFHSLTIRCVSSTSGSPIWVDNNTNKPVSLFECAPGCHAPVISPNVEIITYLQPLRYADINVYPIGTTLQARCREGYLPCLSSGWNPRKNSLAYVCAFQKNDNLWRGLSSGKLEQFPGSACEKSCTAMLHSGAVFYNYSVAAGIAYTMKCRGYQGKETLVCDGATGRFMDRYGHPKHVISYIYQNCS